MTDLKFKVRDAWWYPEQSIGIKVELLQATVMHGKLEYVTFVQDKVKVVPHTEISHSQRVL